MKVTFVQYLKTKSQKELTLHNAKINMAKKPQVA